MALRVKTQEEAATKIADCLHVIGLEWREFFGRLEQYTEAFREDLSRDDLETAKTRFAQFKTFVRNRTTVATRLSDKLLILKKEAAAFEGTRINK